ncbi:MAG TPA: hypothetical protein VIT91_16885 [Chthoniobacterales bacterium]
MKRSPFNQASATGYVAIAERASTKEEFPTAPPENLVADSVVFAPTDQEVPLNDRFQWWTYVTRANWVIPTSMNHIGFRCVLSPDQRDTKTTEKPTPNNT